MLEQLYLEAILAMTFGKEQLLEETEYSLVSLIKKGDSRQKVLDRLYEILTFQGEFPTKEEQYWKRQFCQIVLDSLDRIPITLQPIIMQKDIPVVEAMARLEQILLSLGWDEIQFQQIHKTLETCISIVKGQLDRIELREKLAVLLESVRFYGNFTEKSRTAFVQLKEAKADVLGREEDMAYLTQCLEEWQGLSFKPRCLILYGTSGVGKTSFWKAFYDRLPLSTVVLMVDARSIESPEDIFLFLRKNLLDSLYTYFPRREYKCPVCNRIYEKEETDNLKRGETEGQKFLECIYCKSLIPQKDMTHYFVKDYREKIKEIFTRLDNPKSLIDCIKTYGEALGEIGREIYQTENRQEQTKKYSLLVVWDHLPMQTKPWVANLLMAVSLYLQSPFCGIHFGFTFCTLPEDEILKKFYVHTCLLKELKPLKKEIFQQKLQAMNISDEWKDSIAENPYLMQYLPYIQRSMENPQNIWQAIEMIARNLKKEHSVIWEEYQDSIQNLSQSIEKFHSIPDNLARFLKQNKWAVSFRNQVAWNGFWQASLFQSMSKSYLRFWESKWFWQSLRENFAWTSELVSPALAFSLAKKSCTEEQPFWLEKTCLLYLDFFQKTIQAKSCSSFIADSALEMFYSSLQNWPDPKDKAISIYATVSMWKDFSFSSLEKAIKAWGEWYRKGSTLELKKRTILEIFPYVAGQNVYVEQLRFLADMTPSDLRELWNSLQGISYKDLPSFLMKLKFYLSLMLEEFIDALIAVTEEKENAVAIPLPDFSHVENPLDENFLKIFKGIYPGLENQDLERLPCISFSMRKEILQGEIQKMLSKSSSFLGIRHRLQEQEENNTASLLKKVLAISCSDFPFLDLEVNNQKEIMKEQAISLIKHWLEFHHLDRRIEILLKDILIYCPVDIYPLFQEYIEPDAYLGQIIHQTLLCDQKFLDKLDDVEFCFHEPDWDLSLLLRWATQDGISFLTIQDFKEPAKFIVKLRDAIDPVSFYIKNRFSKGLKNPLNSYKTEDAVPSDLLNKITKALNHLLDTSFYKEDVFSQVKLSEDTQALLLQKDLKGRSLVKLNRLLLEDAYPDEISNSIKNIEKLVDAMVYYLEKEENDCKYVYFKKLLQYQSLPESWNIVKSLLKKLDQKRILWQLLSKTIPTMNWWERLAISKTTYRIIANNVPREIPIRSQEMQELYISLFPYWVFILDSPERMQVARIISEKTQMTRSILGNFPQNSSNLYYMFWQHALPENLSQDILSVLLGMYSDGKQHSNISWILGGLFHTMEQPENIYADAVSFWINQGYFFPYPYQIACLHPCKCESMLYQLKGYAMEHYKKEAYWPALLTGLWNIHNLSLEEKKTWQNLLLVYAVQPVKSDIGIQYNIADRYALAGFFCMGGEKIFLQKQDQNKIKIDIDDTTIRGIVYFSLFDDSKKDFDENSLALPDWKEMSERFYSFSFANLFTKEGRDLWYKLQATPYYLLKKQISEQDVDIWFAKLGEEKQRLMNCIMDWKKRQNI